MATSHSMTNNLPRLTHPDGSPIRALVVDDEPSLSELMSMGLRMAGWSVAVAADGPEAVKLAKEFRPDVLVLDVMLPGFDGVELLSRIRAFAPEVPALFLTAKDAVQDRITGLAAGASTRKPRPRPAPQLPSWPRKSAPTPSPSLPVLKATPPSPSPRRPRRVPRSTSSGPPLATRRPVPASAPRPHGCRRRIRARPAC